MPVISEMLSRAATPAAQTVLDTTPRPRMRPYEPFKVAFLVSIHVKIALHDAFLGSSQKGIKKALNPLEVLVNV
jgi:hypothetical protein